MKTVLVTGGAGFIGSNYVRHFLRVHPDSQVINLDKLTYAGRLESLRDLEEDPRYEFVQGDITNAELVDHLMARVQYVVNFAAESHVDRSIMDAEAFMRTNAQGVYTLLDAARWHGVERFLQVSTDEVYGSLAEGESPWLETAPLAPRNPYAVSKAAGDMMAQAFAITHDLPVLITRAANNVGPFQYPEKRVPLYVTNAMDDLPLPVYGNGAALRDHLFVDDHCAAIDLVLHMGQPGEAYNVGADNDADGMTLTRKILQAVGKPMSLIEHVADRPGHDMRYALNCDKLKALGWAATRDLDSCIEETVAWYADRQDWWRAIKESWDFRTYYARQYAGAPSLRRAG